MPKKKKVKKLSYTAKLRQDRQFYYDKYTSILGELVDLKEGTKKQIKIIENTNQVQRNNAITNWVQSIADLNNSIARALGEGLYLRN